jgi:hypothetical protein
MRHFQADRRSAELEPSSSPTTPSTSNLRSKCECGGSLTDLAAAEACAVAIPLVWLNALNVDFVQTSIVRYAKHAKHAR